jgi:hypothetical protein
MAEYNAGDDMKVVYRATASLDTNQRSNAVI